MLSRAGCASPSGPNLASVGQGRGNMRRDTTRGTSVRSLFALCLLFALPDAALAAQEAEPPPVEDVDEPSDGEIVDDSAPPEDGDAPPALKPSILVLDVTLVDIPPGIEKILIGPISTEVAKDPDLAVMTGQDVRRLTEFEADRIRAGCDEESCASEIADALGADLVVFSTLGRLGTTYIFNMTLIETSSARALGRISANADDVSDLREVVEIATRNLMAGYRKEVGGPTAPPEEAAKSNGTSTSPSQPAAASPAGDSNALLSLAYIGGVAAVAVGIFATGAAIDIFSPTSRNRQLDGIDFLGPGLMLSAIAVGVVPFIFNPFTTSAPSDAPAPATDGRRE